MSKTQEFHSIGSVSRLLQRTPQAINEACAAIDMEPAMRLDGLAYFGADQLERLLQFFARRDAATQEVPHA